MAIELTFFEKLIDAQSALNEEGILKADRRGTPGASEMVVYVVFSPGCSAGAVSVETAHDRAYEGAWAPQGDAIEWQAEDSVRARAITGAHKAIKVRISDAIVGGTVDVYLGAS